MGEAGGIINEELIEIEREGDGEKTNLLAYVSNVASSSSSSWTVEPRRRTRTTSQHHHHRRRRATDAAAGHHQKKTESAGSACCIEARNKQETDVGKEIKQKRGGASVRHLFARGRRLKLRRSNGVDVDQDSDDGDEAEDEDLDDEEPGENGQQAASTNPSSVLNNYGAIRKPREHEDTSNTPQLPQPPSLAIRLLSSTSSQQLAAATSSCPLSTPPMGANETCRSNRRYSAISAPAVSLLSSIADDEEHQPASAGVLVVKSSAAVAEEAPPIKKTNKKAIVSTSPATVDFGPEKRKSVDELRAVLIKRWDQLGRHRLIILHLVLNAYLISLLIAYVSRFHGNTQLSVILLLCFLIGYCNISVLLCIMCPQISGRPIFITLVSLTMATMWPVLIWVSTLCYSADRTVMITVANPETGGARSINGLPAMLLYLCALYSCLTFPKYVDAIWGLLASIIHLVLIYASGRIEEATTQQVCANVFILLTANLFGLCVSLALRHSREFMWREFDDSIEKRATVEYEKERQEQLLLSIIPAHLAARVRKTILNRASKTRESIDTNAEQPRLFHDLHVQQHENVSVLFADIVNFTPLTAELTAPQLVRFLNELYSRFDEIAQEYQCMRIKILGDCYYCVSGMPVSRPNHADNCVKMALAMIEAIKSLREGTSILVDMRIGVHSGSVLCGILGLKKWQYDIWSDDVTIANHMEQGGSPGRVHITKATLQLLSGDYNIIPANTTDPYVIAQKLETYFILPYPPAGSSASTPHIDASTTSIEDIDVVIANGGSAPLAQMPTATGDRKRSQDQSEREPSSTRKSSQNKLKVFTPSTRNFDRAKSFSFRQYHGTTDVSAGGGGVGGGNGQQPPLVQKRSAAGAPTGKANNNNVEMFANNLAVHAYDKQRSTAKMSKITEFWGGAHTPFSNLSRRRSSDHVRAASITAIENNYKQYRWRDLIAAKSVHRSSNGPGGGLLTACCSGGAGGSRRWEGGSNGINMLLDYALTFSDRAVEDSFHECAQPILTPFSTTISAVVVFVIGVIGSTCILASPDVTSAVLFSAILVFLVIVCLIQWNKKLTHERKLSYVPTFSICESYENFYRCTIPGLVLVLSLALAIVFLTVCTQPGKCSNGKYNVCLFQLVLLLIVSSCRPGFLTRCTLAFVAFIVFISVFLSTAAGEDGDLQIKANSLGGKTANHSWANLTATLSHGSPGVTELSFELRAVFNICALIFLVLFVSWLIEYEAKVDWLCVASFRGEQEDVETMQDINTILLHNILPNHVASHFLRPERPPEELYHENHPYVCVMFASIPNFKDFWSQWDFSRQLECLRLLNEIVCEFDKLLAKLKYSNVEKIKTVGSTYMAVCGLHSNPAVQLDPRRYTVIMFEFALAIMNLLEQINRDAFQNFQLRIGMSFGPVIAGVIGAQKPQYDIWGNTVNVASRMDTHGIMGKIHVTQDAAAALQACGYEVESRGLIKVKGIKNEVETYFVHPPSDRRSVAY